MKPMKPNNPPAFPSKITVNDGVNFSETTEPGMTMLDYFAGQALTGLLANPERSGSTYDFTEAAYAYAYQMLIEREKRMKEEAS